MHVSEIQASPPPVKSPPPATEKLEQAFLEEMLKYCGPKSAEGAFGGGIGEDQFSSFLTQEYAAVMAAQIDLGLGKRMGLQ
jgi:flagellar protein FlgJ